MPFLVYNLGIPRFLRSFVGWAVGATSLDCWAMSTATRMPRGARRREAEEEEEGEAEAAVKKARHRDRRKPPPRGGTRECWHKQPVVIGSVPVYVVCY